jgi:hypothetical protein
MIKLVALAVPCMLAPACALDDDSCTGDPSCVQESRYEQELGSTVAYATLPYLEDFEDQAAPELTSRSSFGTGPAWSLRTLGSNTILYGYANRAISIATINGSTLPSKFRFSAQIGYPLMDVIDWLEARVVSQGYMVFDFKSKSDFKYARMVVTRWGTSSSAWKYTYKCVIGKFVGTVDTPLAVTPACKVVDHRTGPLMYNATVEGDGATIRLFIDGELEVSHTLGATPNGIAGVGAATTDWAPLTRKSAGTAWVRSKFDNLSLEEIVAP